MYSEMRQRLRQARGRTHTWHEQQARHSWSGRCGRALIASRAVLSRGRIVEKEPAWSLSQARELEPARANERGEARHLLPNRPVSARLVLLPPRVVLANDGERVGTRRHAQRATDKEEVAIGACEDVEPYAAVRHALTVHRVNRHQPFAVEDAGGIRR